jgi:glycine/D-amino acid oxidase-like deaminating enzyme
LFAANLAEEKETLRNPDDLDDRRERYPRAERAARARFRRLSATAPAGTSAVYDVNRLDGNPVVDRIAPGLFCAWLFSGHGFKFAPAVARALAAGVLEDAAPELPSFACLR